MERLPARFAGIGGMAHGQEPHLDGAAHVVGDGEHCSGRHDVVIETDTDQGGRPDQGREVQRIEESQRAGDGVVAPAVCFQVLLDLERRPAQRQAPPLLVPAERRLAEDDEVAAAAHRRRHERQGAAEAEAVQANRPGFIVKEFAGGPDCLDIVRDRAAQDAGGRGFDAGEQVSVAGNGDGRSRAAESPGVETEHVDPPARPVGPVPVTVLVAVGMHHQRARLPRDGAQQVAADLRTAQRGVGDAVQPEAAVPVPGRQDHGFWRDFRKFGRRGVPKTQESRRSFGVRLEALQALYRHGGR